MISSFVPSSYSKLFLKTNQEYGSVDVEQFSEVEKKNDDFVSDRDDPSADTGITVIQRIKILALAAFAISAMLLIVLFLKEQRLTVYPIRSKLFANNRVKIVLFGDSLVDVAYRRFSLAEKLQNQFPYFLFDIYNAGVGGNKIKNIRNRMYRDVISLNPDIILLYWDSDVSDQDNDFLAEKSTQDEYIEDLKNVVLVLKNTTSNFAIGGPGLLGEGPLFTYNFYNGKNKLLDLYRDINRNVTQENGLLYMDIRRALQEVIPSAWILSRWFCTLDGEHPNERGTQIIAQQFGMAINLFLNG